MKTCTSCQTQIADKAKRCPHCHADQRNWFRRHPLLTALGVIILFILIGTIITSGKSAPTNTASTSGNNGTSSSGTQPSQQPKMANIGDTVTSDNGLAFTVTNVTTQQTVGGQYTQKTAQGMYYIVAVKIQNNGKATQTINASDFNLVDSQGRKYDYSTDGQTAMEMSQGTTNLFLQQIQPSLSVTGTIVFDVPTSATGLKLLVQGSLFSQGQVINLGK